MHVAITLDGSLSDNACEDEMDDAVRQEALRQAKKDRQTDGQTDRRACRPADMWGLNQQFVRPKKNHLWLSR